MIVATQFARRKKWRTARCDTQWSVLLSEVIWTTVEHEWIIITGQFVRGRNFANVTRRRVSESMLAVVERYLVASSTAIVCFKLFMFDGKEDSCISPSRSFPRCHGEIIEWRTYKCIIIRFFARTTDVVYHWAVLSLALYLLFPSTLFYLFRLSEE
jgi:hypothetical protein